MKFGNLTIQNFLAIGYAEVDLDNRGLILIQGDNTDESSASSNGAGKSSVLDALSWVLYGKTAREVSGDDVVNNTRKKDTVVSVAIRDNGNQYWVTRYRKHHAEKNRITLFQVAPVQSDLTGGTDKLTQEAIVNLIGCSYEVFTSAVYAGQEQFPDLPGATDKVLKLLIEEASGVERLERAYRLARDKMNDASRNNDFARQRLDGLLAQQVTCQGRVSAATARVSDYEQAAQAQSAAYADKAVHLRADADALEASVSVALIPNIEAGIATIDAQLLGFKNLQAQERGLAQAKSNQERAFYSAQSVYDVANKACARAESDINNLQFKVNSKCGECGKVYRPEDLQGAHQALLGQHALRITERAQTEKALLMAREASQEAARAFAAFQASLPDVSDLQALRADLEAKRRGILSVVDQAKALRVQAATADSDSQKLLTADNPHRHVLLGEQDALAQCTANIAASQLEVATLESQLLLASAAVSVYSPAGVRAQILDTVTPFLNDRTASYLGALSDGNFQAVWSTLTRTAKGELREKFSIDVSSATGGSSFKAISGGEKRKVRLATAMALQDLVASRATKPLDIFFCDEIDNALDDAGLERLMMVLEDKARDRGTVLVISHNPLSAIRQTITIRKENGIAELIGA